MNSASKRYSPHQGDSLSPEAKAAWNRFWNIHRRMYRWYKEGNTEKMKRRMPKWERLNREAWSFGFDVPDQFDPKSKPPIMAIRRGE